MGSDHYCVECTAIHPPHSNTLVLLCLPTDMVNHISVQNQHTGYKRVTCFVSLTTWDFPPTIFSATACAAVVARYVLDRDLCAVTVRCDQTAQPVI